MMIADYEKKKTPHSTFKSPHMSNIKKPVDTSPRGKVKPTSRRVKEEKGTNAYEDWKKARKYIEMGEHFKANQILINVKRALTKIGASATVMKKLDIDLARARKDPNLMLDEEFGFDSIEKEINKSRVNDQVKAFESQEIEADLYTLFRKAMKYKEDGNYKESLEAFKKCTNLATGPEKTAMQTQVQRLERLLSLQKITKTNEKQQGGFRVVNKEDQVQDFTPVAEIMKSTPIGTNIESLSADYDKKEKLAKRRQAEKLIVEAENSENDSEAIEKLKDAAHLLLVTGTRRDRVEWVYEKINQIKAGRKPQKDTLYEIEKFDPRLLRDFAFNCIDKAKEKADYGKYKKSVEIYKNAVKALKRAGWSQDQVAYIIQDMVNVRKEQDRVEKEQEELVSFIEKEVSNLFPQIDAWRSGTVIENGVLEEKEVQSSIDEEIYLPGKEKTVYEKEMEKLMEKRAERKRMKEMMFNLMDQARQMTDIGKFKDAIRYYINATKIMDELGNWDNQKTVLLKEISNLKSLLEKQQEIVNIQKSFTSTTPDEEREDLEEKYFLIKKAAILNQQDLKEKLLLKRIKEENEKAVFDILIPLANKLKKEGRLSDALTELQEAVKLLQESGWRDEVNSLNDEIKDLKKLIQQKTEPVSTKQERKKIRDEVLENIIPTARKHMLNKNYIEAKRLYSESVEKLREIGWDDYISPIIDNIKEIDEIMDEIKDSHQATASQSESVSYLIEMGMRFLANDMKKYALVEFRKVLEHPSSIPEDMENEITRQVKKLELELKLDESKKILENKKHKITHD